MGKPVTDKIYDILELLESFTKGDVQTCDWQPLMLDKFCDYLKLDRAALFLQGSQSPKLTLVSQNLLQHHDSLYLDYYYNLDPFHFVAGDEHRKKLQLGPGFRKTVVSFNDVVNLQDLQHSEYYQKFMRPQKLAHDLVVYFQSREKLLGVASLMRHKKSGEFSLEEIQLLKIAAPLIALALDNIDLKRQEDLQKQVINLLETESNAEMVILNEGLDVMYATGRELLELAQRDNPVFEAICADCRHLLQLTLANPKLNEPSFKSEVSLNDKLYDVNTRLLYFEAYTGTREGFFVITLTVKQRTLLSNSKIMQTFNLTRRESEIVEAIFKGQRNSEIAREMFISEITVKKHLQNICAKLDVKNRTAIINTILKEFGIL